MRASFLEQALENFENKHEVKKHLFEYFIDGLNAPMDKEEVENTLEIVKRVERSTGWNASSTTLQRTASHNCSQMMILTTWRKKTYKFVNVNYMNNPTDFGMCCRLFPQIDFDDLDKDNKTDEEIYINKKPGVKNGLINGLAVLLDVESFEYSSRISSTGFIMAISDAAGRAMVSQQGIQIFHYTLLFEFLTGFYISPGAETLVSMSAVSYNVTETAFFDFSPEERNCYTNEEFQPLHLNRTRGYR